MFKELPFYVYFLLSASQFYLKPVTVESDGFYGYKCNINNIVVIISKENTGFCNNTTNLIDVKTDALSYCSMLESLLSAEKTNE